MNRSCQLIKNDDHFVSLSFSDGSNSSYTIPSSKKILPITLYAIAVIAGSNKYEAVLVFKHHYVGHNYEEAEAALIAILDNIELLEGMKNGPVHQS